MRTPVVVSGGAGAWLVGTGVVVVGGGATDAGGSSSAVCLRVAAMSRDGSGRGSRLAVATGVEGDTPSLSRRSETPLGVRSRAPDGDGRPDLVPFLMLRLDMMTGNWNRENGSVMGRCVVKFGLGVQLRTEKGEVRTIGQNGCRAESSGSKLW